MDNQDNNAIATPATPAATPENTPLPGGGSWHWDEPTGAWAENLPYAPPIATTTTATQE